MSSPFPEPSRTPKMPELPPLSGAGPLPAAMHINTNAHAQGNPFAGLPEEQLLDLRHHLDALLPTRRLKDVSMEVELVRQLAVVHRLQRETLDDQNCPANQKSQVLGQVANILAVLSKLQAEVYSSERLKIIEANLIECLQELPTDTQEKFFTAYEAKLG